MNSEIRYASSPEEVKHYDTAQLRSNYLIENVFSADEVNLTYTMHDRDVNAARNILRKALEMQKSA